MMKKIVISGATGAIGIALINCALEQKMQVLALCHKNSKRIVRLPKTENLRILELSVEEYSELISNKEKLASIGEYDCFFHLAWQGTTGSARNDMDLQLCNIRYTLDAVELAAGLGCKCFVGAGSQAEYGRVEGMISSATPAFPENGYGIAKLCAGQMSRIRCEQLKIKHIWTRILSVYGPGDSKASLIMTAINGFLNQDNTEFTAGMQNWDYLYSKDAARILMGLSRHGEHGYTYCVGSGKIQLLKEYIHQIYVAINGRDESDDQLGIGRRPYMDKQVMYLQADTKEWPMELKQELEESPLCSFVEGIQYTIDWVKRL
ncbi:MAG: NAD-dependent epimerase/dehydratase family protein [Clostridiales bacterium]|nr:NAD-dependent epimerase/dehydratase family protein [Clostridiales bacterium]